MKKIAAGEAGRPPVKKWAWLAVGMAALVPLGVAEALTSSAETDPAVIKANFIEQWITGENGCLGSLFEFDRQDGRNADFSYDPATGTATVQASVLNYDPETKKHEWGLAGPQPPNAYYLANNMLLYTLRFRYDASAQPGFRLVPASPPDSLMVFRTCYDLTLQYRPDRTAPPTPPVMPAPLPM